MGLTETWAALRASRVAGGRRPALLAQVTGTHMALGVLLLAAFLIRWWGLDGKSLWFDEAYSVYIAQQPLADIPRLLRLNDTHPPFHYLLLHFWMAFFGRSEIAVRAPSVLASLGVILLTYTLARRLLGERVALLAAGILAFSPFQVMAAQEARMYPFLALFAAGATYALWMALEEGGRARWVVYVGAMLGALMTHHFGFLIVLAHGAYVFLVDRRSTARRAWGLALGAIALGYAPLIPMFIGEFISARGWPDIRPPFGVRSLTNTLGLFAFGGGLFGMGDYFQRGTLPLQYQGALLLPFVLLVGAGAAAAERRRRLFLLGYWLVPVVVMALVSLRWNLYYERYFSFVLPPFAILVAAGILHVARALPGRQCAAAVVGLMALIAAFAVPALADVYRVTSNYDWRGAARYVDREAKPQDFILFVPAFGRIPFEYYFTGPQRRDVLNPRELIVGRTVTFETKVNPEVFGKIARQHPTMWLIGTVPIGYEARIRLMALLDPYFREIRGIDFGRVYVFRWDSKVYRPTSPAR